MDPPSGKDQGVLAARAADKGKCPGQPHHLRIAGDVADQPAAAVPWLDGTGREEQQAALGVIGKETFGWADVPPMQG